MKWTLLLAGAIGMLAGRAALADSSGVTAEQWQKKAQCEEHRADAASQKAQALEAQLKQAQGEKPLVDVRTSLLFPVNETKPIESAKTQLAPVVAAVKDAPGAIVHLEGHADSTGPEQYNQTLSMERAETVKQELVAEGVSPQRIDTKAVGESDPLASNATVSGRAVNRRVDVTIQAPSPMPEIK